MTAYKCNGCGKTYNKAYSFCPSCGRPVRPFVPTSTVKAHRSAGSANGANKSGSALINALIADAVFLFGVYWFFGLFGADTYADMLNDLVSFNILGIICLIAVFGVPTVILHKVCVRLPNFKACIGKIIIAWLIDLAVIFVVGAIVAVIKKPAILGGIAFLVIALFAAGKPDFSYTVKDSRGNSRDYDVWVNR